MAEEVKDHTFENVRPQLGPDGRDIFAIHLWAFVKDQGLKIDFYKYQMEKLRGTGHKEDPEMPDNQ